MPDNQRAGTRILDAYARLSAKTAADLAAGRAAGLPEDELADLAAQDLAARNRYQELAVDLHVDSRRFGSTTSDGKPRPWWRFW